MKTISIELDDAAAERYLKLSETERKKVMKEFSRLLARKRTLREVMDDMSEQARKNGLTPEILDELLKDE